MNIYYTNNTLFVNIKDEVNDLSVSKLKFRVFSILDDYDIDNIVLNIITSERNDYLIDLFVREYNQKYHGNILIK